MLPTLINPFTNDDQGFGDDEYCYVDGERHLRHYARTLRPVGAESTETFERRMDTYGGRLAELQASGAVERFTLRITRRAHAAAECFIEVWAAVPVPAPVACNDRPAGGVVATRGTRGGERSSRGPALRMGLGLA